MHISLITIRLHFCEGLGTSLIQCIFRVYARPLKFIMTGLVYAWPRYTHLFMYQEPMILNSKTHSQYKNDAHTFSSSIICIKENMHFSWHICYEATCENAQCHKNCIFLYSIFLLSKSNEYIRFYKGNKLCVCVCVCVCVCMCVCVLGSRSPDGVATCS